MATIKKTAQTNYSADVLTNIINDYQKTRTSDLSNAVILADLSAKYGKTIPSLRAKLASLKVYQKDTETSNTSETVKATKSQYVSTLERLTGLSLDSLESATKAQLQDLCLYVNDLKATVHELKNTL